MERICAGGEMDLFTRLHDPTHASNACNPGCDASGVHWLLSPRLPTWCQIYRFRLCFTWDRNLTRQRGAGMGAEHYGKGVNYCFGAYDEYEVCCCYTCGRNRKGFGAVPFLSGVATAEMITGMQHQGVIACVKHFIGNEQEHFRGGSEAEQIQSSNIDDRTLHELYAYPFAEAVKVGDGSVMYVLASLISLLFQMPACQNSRVFNGLLKEELDFQGFVLSDWAALINGVQPAPARTDVNMPVFIAYPGPSEPNPTITNHSWWGSALIEAVHTGSVTEAPVDDMVTRSIAAFFNLGQAKGHPSINFDYNSQNTFFDGQSVQGDHIHEIGAASTVLLKNVNALPLNTKIKRLDIFGSDAGPNPDGPNRCQNGNGECVALLLISPQGTLAMGCGPALRNSPTSSIYSAPSRPSSIVPIEGVLDDFNFGTVDSVASKSDVCFVFANADSGYIAVNGNGGNRNNLTLWHGGDALFQRTASQCSNTIIVMHIVRTVIVVPWVDHPNIAAVLHAGLPGQDPEEGLDIDYRNFDTYINFGFGLSYTKFAYNGLNIRPGHGKRQEPDVATTEPIETTGTASTAPGVASSAATSTAASAASSAASTTASAASSAAFSAAYRPVNQLADVPHAAANVFTALFCS
ncbi:glycoside hydrolase family 3 protein [Sphaerobolus stellatus SS14]|nr:glycoside hydrolase family 3 protein [Sphaerobolus stellatus SS14]